MTKFNRSALVRRPSGVNPGENLYKPHMLWNHSSLATFFVTDSKAPKATTHIRQACRPKSAL